MKTIICHKCDEEFFPEEKLRLAKQRKISAGKVNECLDCASSEPTRYSGTMICGNKTASEIQINKDPRITEYLKNAGGARRARSLGKTSLFNHPHSKNGVAYAVIDIAKRR